MVLKNAIYTITVWATEPKTKLCVCTFGTVVQTNTIFHDLEKIKLPNIFYLSLGILMSVQYNNLLSRCITNFSCRFLRCGVVMQDGREKSYRSQ